MKAWLLLLCFVSFLALPARAHEVRPALLEIVRTADSFCRITWKTPMSGGDELKLTPVMSGGWLNAAPVRTLQTPTYRLKNWSRSDCSVADLSNQSIAIDGLDETITDVLVRIEYGDGRAGQFALHPGAGPQSLRAAGHATPAAPIYFVLGVEHILTGFDHLAFVFGLILLVGFKARLALAVSGFTIAHSLTLGATALGLVQPWPAFIEALVALSIVFVAAEALKAQGGRATLIARWPLIASGGFGLLHGFAFAGAVAEIGLPQSEKVQALLFFNLGVEVGQLVFIAAAFLGAAAIRRLRVVESGRAPQLPSYSIGVMAAYWFCERAAGLFSPSL